MKTNKLNPAAFYIDNAVINIFNSNRLIAGEIMNNDINDLQELRDAGYDDVTIDDLSNCYDFIAAIYQGLAIQRAGEVWEN